MRNRSLAGSLAFLIFELLIIFGGIYLLQFDDTLLWADDRPAFWRILLYFAMTVAVLNVVTRSVRYLYQRRNYAKRRGAKNFVYGVENVRKLLLSVVVVVTILSLFGINVPVLFTSLSIVAAAIAIISKEFVNDLIVGLYYSFTDIFEVGDYVKFYNYKGRVADIGLLKIKILNDNDDVVILPNGKVFASEIINYTRRDVRVMSIDFEMDIKSIKNVDQLEEELKDSLATYADVIEENSYLLKIMEVKKDFMEMKFQLRLKNLDRPQQREIKRRVVRKIFNYVGSHGPKV
jgi:small-conductance mechanosensitive channel